ncbi:glycosyl hydrolases 15 family protein [Mycobacterium intracellulare]|nr:glycosyl hydrolases 15 family protein [Mycobacterium intracellulare]
MLREYALLADGERGALIGPQGDVAWMCAPHWDSDAVFSNLIGGGGVYAVTPTDVRHVWGGYYEPGSLIWRNRWTTRDGIVECRDALAFPGDPDRAVLLRRLTGCRGTARVRVLLAPSAGFGRHGPGKATVHDRVWSARSGPLRWRWQAGCDARPVRAAQEKGELLTCEITLEEGQHHDLVLELSEHALPDQPPDPDLAWEATPAAWQRSVPELSCTIAPRDGRSSYAVLRGLTSSGGGMVAAATMSLPERAHSNQNYDYRYSWIRDQVYAGMAAAAVGTTELLDRAVEFISARLLEDGPNLKPAYTITGGAVPGEETLDLPGYPGGADKIGNWVNQQFQLDAFGEALQLLAKAGAADRLDADGWRAAQTAIKAIEKRWREPDAGVWEIDNERWTQSRLACVGGYAPSRNWPAPDPRWPRALRWPTRSSPRPHRKACTRTGIGNAAPGRRGSTHRCCCRRCAGPCPPTTRGPSPRWTPFAGNSPTTGSSTASGTTNATSATPRERSCSAGS